MRYSLILSFALLMALGTGAGAGIVGVSSYGDRILHRDVAFAITLSIAGASMMAASFTRTLPLEKAISTGLPCTVFTFEALRASASPFSPATTW